MVVSMKESHCGLLLLTYIRTLRKNSSDPIPIKQQPLTPGDILFKPEKQPPIVTGFSPRAREQSSIGWKCDDAPVPGSFSRHASTADFLPLELPLGDSDDYLCPPASYTPMDKLVGVFMYVKYCPLLAPSLINFLTLPGIRSYNPQKKPLPVQKLEFVRAVSGGIRYVIVTLSPNCLARFFHRCACHVPSIESMRLTSTQFRLYPTSCRIPSLQTLTHI